MDGGSTSLSGYGKVAIPLEFLSELSDARTSEALYRSISTWLPRIVRCDRMSIALRHDETTLRVVAFGGENILDEGEPWPIEGTKLGHCFTTRQPVVISNSDIEDDRYAASKALKRLDYKSTVILPLVARGACFGTLNFGAREPDYFPPETIEELKRIAVWIAAQLNHHETLTRLVSSEARFNAMIDNANSTIFAKSRDGEMLVANKKFHEMFGFAPGKVVGRYEDEIFDRDLTADWRVEDRAVIDHREKQVIEEEISYPDGTIHPHITQKFPMFDPVREEYIVCGISTDISDRKQAEQALAASEERARAFFDNTPSVMYMKGPDHTIRFANVKFLEFYGLTEDEAIGAPSERYLEPELVAQIEAYDDEIMATGDAKQRELLIPGPDGIIRNILVTKFPVHDGAGKIVGIGGVNTDVTELREREEQLRIAKEEAEMAARMFEQAANKARTADRAKSEFLASMSHEIRTPLNGVLGMASLLLDTEIDRAQRDKLETIRDSGQTLLTILNDILDLSKIEAGELQFENSDFSIPELVSEIDGLWSPQVRAKAIDWACAVDAPIAPFVHGDGGRIRQVLSNLVSNAIKFTEAGAISLRVTQTPASGGSVSCRFEVGDTGLGIPSELRSRLFDKFTQADSSIARRFGGTGLGLAICKLLVEGMGGEIGFDSEEGAGSTFWFTIVAPPGTAAAIETGTGRPAGTDGTSRTGEATEDTPPLAILVAEDNAINQKIVSLMLSRGGHRFDIVRNGIEAVEAVARSSYDLVLMDIQMPEMDGLEATRRIRDLPGPESEIPIIALTANAMKGDREKYLAAGMSDYVSKPIDLAVLLAAIARQARPGRRGEASNIEAAE